jgi:hypothetical protein
MDVNTFRFLFALAFAVATYFRLAAWLALVPRDLWSERKAATVKAYETARISSSLRAAYRTNFEVLVLI